MNKFAVIYTNIEETGETYIIVIKDTKEEAEKLAIKKVKEIIKLNEDEGTTLDECLENEMIYVDKTPKIVKSWSYNDGEQEVLIQKIKV
jgi:hypothetical protein